MVERRFDIVDVAAAAAAAAVAVGVVAVAVAEVARSVLELPICGERPLSLTEGVELDVV
jgi:hypothetical protein